MSASVRSFRDDPKPYGGNPANACADLSPADRRSGAPEIGIGCSSVRLAILIPAYECEATIGTVVRNARAHVQRVLVVDDGSRDETSAVAHAAGADVLRHPVNRGKGTALLTGMWALSRLVACNDEIGSEICYTRTCLLPRFAWRRPNGANWSHGRVPGRCARMMRDGRD